MVEARVTDFQEERGDYGNELRVTITLKKPDAEPEKLKRLMFILRRGFTVHEVAGALRIAAMEIEEAL